jgi:hypothetical protein
VHCGVEENALPAELNTKKTSILPPNTFILACDPPPRAPALRPTTHALGEHGPAVSPVHFLQTNLASPNTLVVVKLTLRADTYACAAKPIFRVRTRLQCVWVAGGHRGRQATSSTGNPLAVWEGSGWTSGASSSSTRRCERHEDVGGTRSCTGSFIFSASTDAGT